MKNSLGNIREVGTASSALLRDRRDSVLIFLALVHGVALLLWPGLLVVALGIWWHSNTIAHYFIHRPFFFSPLANRSFQLYETILLGVPQTLWRERHLAHHGEREWRFKWSRALAVELTCIAGLWALLIARAPHFFIWNYLPGWGLGLLLCQLQGYFEHQHGATSHYGRWYNFLFLNDGYHFEHHQRPQMHWRELPFQRLDARRASRWPAVLRWLDIISLVSLEKLLLRSTILQWLVLRKHENAMRKLLVGMEPKRIVIVGGGLFPRSAIVLRKLFPAAELIVLEKDPAHIEIARQFLEGDVAFECGEYRGQEMEADLLILPLSFQGSVSSILRGQKVPVLLHEWLGTPARRRKIVSPFLWKQVSLYLPGEPVLQRDLLRHPLLFAASAFILAALAKYIWLWDRTIPAVWSTPFIYLWQDALVALLLGVFFCLLPITTCRVTAYAAFAIFTALNVPLQKALSTPFTWNMLGAAQGTLADSIKHHFTALNFILISLILAVAVIFPVLLRRTSGTALRSLTLVLVVISFIGAAFSSSVRTEGLERNAILAFAQSAITRTAPLEGSNDWRKSTFSAGEKQDLTKLAGIAAGRNVVLVVLESTGAQYLKPWGANIDPMPNLTKLAKTGLVYENAYAVYPESIKGLFSLLFSSSPAIDLKPEQHVQSRPASLAASLASAGYRTGLFHSGRFMYLGMDSIVEAAECEMVADAGLIGGNVNSSFGVDEPATVAAILHWLDAHTGPKPFFLTYLPIAGHHPYDTPEPGPFAEDKEATQYLNALHFGDQALGELVNGLRARGLYEKTLFVVVGDHGEAFGQHEGNFGHTLALYEENVKVPLLFAAPGAIQSPDRVAQIASMVDLAPTILSLLGQESPAEWEGHTLLEPRDRMALFFTDYSLRLVGLRDGPFKFIHDLGSGHSKLFDLRNDPWETRDLSEEHSRLAIVYARHLREWVSAQKYKVQFGSKVGANNSKRPRLSG